MANGVKLTVLEGPNGPLVAKEAADEVGRSSIRAEQERLARAVHPGVVAVVEAGTDRLTLAWAGTDSLDRLRPPVPEAAALLAAVASTVADLHQIGIVHGRIDPTHVLVGADGRPRLCSFRGTDPGAAPAEPVDDVAALGALIDHLMGPGVEAEPIPERRWGRRRWLGHQRRTLLALADHALHPDPTRRPSARALAASIATAMPDARIASTPSFLGRPDEASPGGLASPTEQVPGEPAPAAGAARRARLVLAAIGLGAIVLVGIVGRLGPDRDRPTLPAAAWSAGVSTAKPKDPVGPRVAASTPVPERPDCSRTRAPGPRGGADVDGDGCADPVEVRGTSIVAGGVEYDIGEPGDRVSVADWDCDGVATPGIVRPATDEVFVFDGWATEGDPVTIEATSVITGADRLRAPRSADRCDAAVVLEDRTTRPLRHVAGGGS